MNYFNGNKFLFTFVRERVQKAEILEFEATILKLKVLSFFYGYNCLEDNDKPFLYMMYIKGFLNKKFI